LFGDIELPVNRRFSQALLACTGEVRLKSAASGRVACNPEAPLFAIVAVPFDAYAALPRPEYRWLLTCLARYTDPKGCCWPSMRQLAQDARMSLASVCRYLKGLADLEVFQRTRRPGGRYCYTLAEAYRPRWPGRVSAAQRSVSGGGTQEAKPAKQIFKRRFAEDLLEEPWEQRLESWRSSRFWLPNWGPKPSEPGCWASPALLRATMATCPKTALSA
jgi:hypothetical protein